MQALEQLLDIMARLRAQDGCPWDREQTLETLKQCLVEECYEVIDALNSGQAAQHKDELGDLLLQIVFQAQIRQERGEFNFEDVVRQISAKLIRRHPHVFSGQTVADSAEVLKNWEAIKAREKPAAPAGAGAAPPRSLVAGIPSQLPALLKAQRIQSRVARVGFDWQKLTDVVAKVAEELAEVQTALATGSAQQITEEIGDLLFAVVNLSRFQELNAEEALNHAVAKFVRRFQAMEERLWRAGRQITQCSLAELDALWNEVKALE